MQNVRAHEHIINNFSRFNKKQQKSILKNLDSDQIKFFVELCHNLLEGFPIFNKKALKRTLKKRHIQAIRKVACPKTCLKKKKQKIIKGGFLPPLIATLGGVALSTLIEKFMNEKDKNNESQKSREN